MYNFSPTEFGSAILLGLPLVMVLWAICMGRRSLWQRALIVTASLIVWIVVAWLVSPPREMSPREWYDSNPWRHLILYAFMMLGIFISGVNEALKERQAKALVLREERKSRRVKLRFDSDRLLRAALLSWMTYGFLNSQLQGRELNVASSILAIQTGFFWQTITERQMSLELNSRHTPKVQDGK